MGISDTSRQSYAEVKADGTEKTQLQEYLSNLGTFFYSDRTMAKLMHLPCSTISARRNKAMKMGLVRYAGTTHDLMTNKTVKVWGLRKEK